MRSDKAFGLAKLFRTLDRLLRCEANLERNFDRALTQLERLQRMRLGQPVLPKLEVRGPPSFVVTSSGG